MATAGRAPASIGNDGTATNPRGIPNAPFVDRVEDYVATREEVEPTLRSFQEMISKYQFMEMNLQRRMAGLKDKIPEIQKTLDTVRFLKLRKANVMLSYTTDEAETLLSSKLATAKTSLSHCEEDLDFLREQITTMEVATARVYNWEVVQKRKDKSGEEVTKGQSGEKTGPSKN
ncbi:Prefoldin, partial [Metarhizium brunneum ARSEF 3297]